MSTVIQVLEKAKQIKEDGYIDINENRYDINKMPFMKSEEIFSFYSSIQNQIALSNFSFLRSDDFKNTKKVMFDYIDFDGAKLNSRKEHFDNEDYEGDYLALILVSFTVFSYPLLKGVTGK